MSAATVDVSLLHHEKDVLLEKTKAQDNEIMSLRLKVEAFEKKKEVGLLQLLGRDVWMDHISTYIM